MLPPIVTSLPPWVLRALPFSGAESVIITNVHFSKCLCLCMSKGFTCMGYSSWGEMLQCGKSVTCVRLNTIGIIVHSVVHTATSCLSLCSQSDSQSESDHFKIIETRVKYMPNNRHFLKPHFLRTDPHQNAHTQNVSLLNMPFSWRSVTYSPRKQHKHWKTHSLTRKFKEMSGSIPWCRSASHFNGFFLAPD